MAVYTTRRLFLTVALLAMSRQVSGAELGYVSQPALHDDTLVFVSEGDLWVATVPETPGVAIVAHRLTSSRGAETHPTLTPDGSHLLFSAEYDGNTDVYLMPADGGRPQRLTFHPGPDIALCFSAEGRSAFFRSRRANPLGRWELWETSILGGTPRPLGFGECSMAVVSSSGRRIAFTQWSNEHWTWKRYRGGTAPEIWIGDLRADTFQRLTNNPANDLHPMFVLGRVYFQSDRTGTGNIFSVDSSGGDLKQHTSFAPRDDPTSIDGYDIRWPSADTQRRGRHIVFAQAGELAILDVTDDSLRRLDVRLASDRVARRTRFAEPMKTATGFALSPDGDHLLVGSRGELLDITVDGGTTLHLTRASAAREWGASYIDEEHVILVSDLTGEQQIAAVPRDASDFPTMLTEDREAWLFPPVASPDGRIIAFADNTARLHVLSMQTLIRSEIDSSSAWEIDDYRFSPDSNWIAWTKPMPSGLGAIMLHAFRTGRTFQVSDGLHDDREPRWDPAGKYLYFLSKRHLDPVLGDLDFEHVFVRSSRVVAVPLAADTPPPFPAAAKRVGFDLEKWASPPESTEADRDGDANDEIDDGAAEEVLRIDTDGLPQRHHLLPIEPGIQEHLEAVHGGVCYLSAALRGLGEEPWPKQGFGSGRHTLIRYDLVEEKPHEVAEHIPGYAISAQRNRVAWPTKKGFRVAMLANPGDHVDVDLGAVRLRVNVELEWRQIFREAWRLQRDFYWAPNYKGIDWPAILTKYEALLPRVGTRAELNDLIGQMIGELGTSHTYVFGGDRHDKATPVEVGLLGADIELDPNTGGFRIARILPRHAWGDLESPLAAAHNGIEEGNYIIAVDGEPLTTNRNIYDLLQDKADKPLRLTIVDDPTGAGKREVTIKAIDDERGLRYTAWVEENRARVDAASEGLLGYLHIPDMGAEGLAAFSRYFYPQLEKKGLVVDVRGNGGGFVSQMIIARLNRHVWAFMRPRHGKTERYPMRSLHGHLAVLIDQHAGSDGDIFPESVRLLEIGPLIGTRTWGGVVGIRGDKPFVDFGLSTQPEFAWWEPQRGWSLENSGVSPDIVVPITPGDRLAGKDPQLDKAIEVILKKLAEEPMELPEPPPWPE